MEPNAAFTRWEMDRNLELTKRCLTLISRIAARGASSPDPERVYDTLMELQFALRRDVRGASAVEFPLSAEEVNNLGRAHRDLAHIDSTSDEFSASDFLKYASRSTWN